MKFGKLIAELFDCDRVAWAERQVAAIVGEAFDRHGATLSYDRRGILWSRPNSSTYRVRYDISADARHLVVTGDLGCAVFFWGSTVNWELLSVLNLDYFASKCAASAQGRGFKAWSAEKARIDVRAALTERRESGMLTWSPGLPGGVVDRDQMFRWLEEQRLQDLANSGEHIGFDCVWMLLGLRCAIASLVAEGLIGSRTEGVND